MGGYGAIRLAVHFGLAALLLCVFICFNLGPTMVAVQASHGHPRWVGVYSNSLLTIILAALVHPIMSVNNGTEADGDVGMAGEHCGWILSE